MMQVFFTIELFIRFCGFRRKRNCIHDMWFVFDVAGAPSVAQDSRNGSQLACRGLSKTGCELAVPSNYNDASSSPAQDAAEIHRLCSGHGALDGFRIVGGAHHLLVCTGTELGA